MTGTIAAPNATINENENGRSSIGVKSACDSAAGRFQKYRAADYERADDHNFHYHQRTLYGAARANAETIDERENSQRERGKRAAGNGNVRQLDKIFSKCDGHRGHSAGLDYQQQRPSVKKSDAGVIGLAHVGILAADGGHARGKLGVNKCAGHGDESTENPRA